MIERTYDPDVLRSIGDEFLKEEFLPIWLGNPHNVLLIEDEDIGIATHEYPGLYTVHWFFKRRGREALKLARRMFAYMFENHGAQALRGFTPVNNKAARWASRQVGLKSQGLISTPDGREHEFFIITKDEFYNDKERGID